MQKLGSKVELGSASISIRQSWGPFLFLFLILSIAQGCRNNDVVVTYGYLTHQPPPGLRFSPPTNFAANLPPLPKSDDPQPSVIPEAVEEDQVRSAIDSNPPPAFSYFGTNRPPVFENRATNYVEALIPPSTMTQQILLRLNPDGQPSGVEVYPVPTPAFQPPPVMPSSSASYQVR